MATVQAFIADGLSSAKNPALLEQPLGRPAQEARCAGSQDTSADVIKFLDSQNQANAVKQILEPVGAVQQGKHRSGAALCIAWA